MYLRPIFLDSTSIFWSDMGKLIFLRPKMQPWEFYYTFGHETYVVAENVSQVGGLYGENLFKRCEIAKKGVKSLK